MRHTLLITAKGVFISGSLFLLPVISPGQAKPVNCKDIREGIFYYYPKNTSDQYIENMDGQLEHATNLKSGDTTLFRITWDKNCSYSEKYITGNTKLTLQQRQILEKNTFVYKITDITKDYYTFTMYMDKTADIPLSDDTLWFNAQAHPTNKRLFTFIPNNAALRKEHFRDTSHFAVVYLYRPRKFTNFLNFYPVYLDNIEMCVAENNTGYIFKVLKEGPLEIKGILLDHTASVTLPVSFGHTYYVETRVHWGAGTKKGTYPEMQVVDPEAGKAAFAAVKLRSS